MTALYKWRLAILVMIDSLIVSLSIYLSHFFLNPYFASFDKVVAVSALSLLASHHFFSMVLGMYRKKWRYASIEELFGIIVVVSLSILTTVAVQTFAFGDIYERSLMVTWLLHIMLIGGVRFAWRYYNTHGMSISPRHIEDKTQSSKNTLIIGAGSAGRMLARQMKDSQGPHTNIVGFIDDDLRTHNLTIAGFPVLGGTTKIEYIVREYHVNHVVIAMPSVTRDRIKSIVEQTKSVVTNIQTLPMLEDIAMGNVSVNQIRDVQIEDLLGREPVELDIESIDAEIRGRTVLVTGAGGSIGSEICRQLTRFAPKQLVLLGHGENSIYHIHRELNSLKLDIEIMPVIADVQDRERIFQVVRDYGPSYIYHAAAHKHVPLMEGNPKEAFKNNVIGTKNVSEAADAAGVKTFVLVSTDKAVNPPNIMGATKRMAEMVIQTLSKQSQTKYVAVRFGNVLGSRGSVIPLFKNQIKNGGPVTVTHEDMTRYFMTIPEASRLVLQAGALARGGEIFVLDMGEQVKIVDLARNLIHLSGFAEDEIPIEFAGIRPGEKMYEELLGEDEVHSEPIFPKILIGKTVEFDSSYVSTVLNQFERISDVELKQVVIEIANSGEQSLIGFEGDIVSAQR